VSGYIRVRSRVDRLEKKDVVELLPDGSVQDVCEAVEGVEVDGNKIWLKKPNGLYFWSGVTDFDGTAGKLL
jgi:hypothetical protein